MWNPTYYLSTDFFYVEFIVLIFKDRHILFYKITVWRHMTWILLQIPG
jgi:hypothetical protein